MRGWSAETEEPQWSAATTAAASWFLILKVEDEPIGAGEEPWIKAVLDFNSRLQREARARRTSAELEPGSDEPVN